MAFCHSQAFSLGFTQRWRDASKCCRNPSFWLGPGLWDERGGGGSLIRGMCVQTHTGIHRSSWAQGSDSKWAIFSGWLSPAQTLLWHNLSDRVFIPTGILCRDCVSRRCYGGLGSPRGLGSSCALTQWYYPRLTTLLAHLAKQPGHRWHGQKKDTFRQSPRMKVTPLINQVAPEYVVGRRFPVVCVCVCVCVWVYASTGPQSKGSQRVGHMTEHTHMYPPDYRNTLEKKKATWGERRAATLESQTLRPRFRSRFLCLIPVWPQERHFTSLSLFSLLWQGTQNLPLRSGRNKCEDWRWGVSIMPGTSQMVETHLLLFCPLL